MAGSKEPTRLEPVSATFHGRDMFAPVAAHLARGSELAEAGDPLAVGELERLELPSSRIDAGVAVGHALTIDVYGNVALNLAHADLLEAGLTIGSRVTVAADEVILDAVVAHTFADVNEGEALVYEDAFGSVAIAINRGDAATALSVTPDVEMRIARA